ncbi:glycosyltransferase [Cytobacillus sp.]|uniref:glycosyltransferase n=1 Tax=Cytobacillus sp. TaxID=2675269 RepID=UPI0028BD7033|nr:glycosyltransferase [Cytobacillus sp.]
MKFTGERFIPDSKIDNEIEYEHIQRYYSVTDLVKGKTVLDAACGEGYGSNTLAQYAHFVYGIDIDEETIEHARKKYNTENIRFFNSSIDRLPFEDNSIDVVISFETIEHVNEELQNKFLFEIKRVLKKDGLLIMSTPNKKIYSDYRKYSNPFHMKEFYIEEFRKFLESQFEHVELFFQYKEIVYLLGDEESKQYRGITQEPLSEYGKYIVAVCSNEKIEDLNINSIIVDKGNYNNTISRIMELQEQVEERNSHISKLDADILEKDNYINNLNEEKNRLENDLSCENELLRKDLESAKFELTQFEKNRDETINNIKNELEQLKGIERELNNILESDGWAMLLKYYKLRDKLFPKESKFRLFIKLFYRVVCKKNIKLINRENFKKLKYYMKSDNVSLLESRIDNYIDRNSELETSNNLVLTGIVEEYNIIEFEKQYKLEVSIIIPVYNKWEYTYSCLKSIYDNTKNISYEVIIADDMSTDETVNINEYIKNVKVIRDGQNRGFLLNCNNAAKFAEGKYILFLNNDTNVQENWLSTLVELMEKDKNAGMVGSKLVYPDGRLQEAGGIIWDDASGWNYGRLDNPQNPEYNYVKEVDYISGASIMIRKSLWEKIGGFDERYAPAYFEDSDLAFEVRNHGYKVILQPKSVVVHFEGISHGNDVYSGVKRYQELNKKKFVEKWSNVLSTEHYKNGEHVFKARDRSKFKKTILVIDHYVPHFDKDAGSRTTYHYLKLFVQMGFNVKFIGDNYFKHEPYTSELQDIGIEVLYGPYNFKNIEGWLKRNGQDINYVYLNRPHISIKYIDMLKNHTNARIVYYGHDLHFLREYREFELTGNKLLKESAEEWKKTEFSLYEKSDVIYYPSDVEVDEIKKYYPKINAKSIPAYIYDEKNYIKEDFSKKEGLLFVGGFSHKPNIDAVHWFVSSVFPEILEKKPSMKFYIVGSNPPSEITDLSSTNIIVTGFVSDDELLELYKECRLVVVPLRYGAGVKGKVIEALYHQVPVITTTVGAEGINGSEEILTISDTESGFANNVIDLYDDIDKLNQLSKSSLEFVLNNFSTSAVIKVISEDISK